MTDISIFDAFAKGSRAATGARGRNAVIYTRVSTKDQTENMSLATQLKACSQYAEKHGYAVLATFGSTYESATTDERKEFQAMLAYLKKSREKIDFILVASLERFSRNDNSIWLSGQLRTQGVSILSVSQPIDTSSASGQMQQKMLFLFGEFDNQLRKQKCVAGIKEMLHRGDWPTMPAMGYDVVRADGKRKIVVNQKGRLLRQAFEWKAHEGVSNEVIRMRLREKGLKLHKQRLSEIFRNPFYCGLMAHNMLEGRLVEGNHERLVSRELFLEVNGLLDKNAHGYKVREENDAIPLKRFLLCDHCGRPLRGYEVRKKAIFYYKCCTVGCGNNKSASSLNQTFARILEAFRLDAAPDVIGLIRKQTVATFNQFTRGQEDAHQSLRHQYQELARKVNRLEERYIDEEINAHLYNRYAEKYAAEKREIEQQIQKASKQVSNLEECVDIAVDFASKMPFKWLSADYHTKQRIQFLIFPEGIRYDKKTDRCRTTRINSVFSYLAHLQQGLAQMRRGIPELNLDYASLSSWVAGAGLEPTTFGL